MAFHPEYASLIPSTSVLQVPTYKSASQGTYPLCPTQSRLWTKVVFFTAITTLLATYSYGSLSPSLSVMWPPRGLNPQGLDPHQTGVDDCSAPMGIPSTPWRNSISSQDLQDTWCYADHKCLLHQRSPFPVPTLGEPGSSKIKTWFWGRGWFWGS